jgi:hypothetical protein
MKYVLARYRRMPHFRGYLWVDVPNGAWPHGGMFDGRGAEAIKEARRFTYQEACTKVEELCNGVINHGIHVVPEHEIE